MMPLKTTVSPSASSTMGCAPRSERSMIESRRWASALPSWNHVPAPSGPRGASTSLMRASASRSGADPRRSSPAIPHMALHGEDGGVRARRGEVGVQRVHDLPQLRLRAVTGARALSRRARRDGERAHGLELGGAAQLGGVVGGELEDLLEPIARGPAAAPGGVDEARLHAVARRDEA